MRLIARVAAACLATSPVAAPALAQDAVHAAYEAALAESPTPALIRTAQAGWQSEWTEYPDSRADMEEMRLTELRALSARDRSIRADRLALSDLNTVCVDTRMMDCEVSDSGSLSLPDGATIYYQMQSGSTEEEGMGSAMIVMTATGATLTPIYWLAGPLGVLKLETWKPDEGPTYVAVPAYGQGTGSHWVGSVFRWNGAGVAPTEIDAQTWLDTLNDALPAGLGVWKGPEFHWDWMMAESPLWQDSDANCCATGGRVYVELKVEDEALVAASVSVEDSILTVAANVEPEVLAWVSRREHCESLQAREPFDDADRATIAAGVERLNCSTLNADEARLRATYAEDAATLALLTRAKAETNTN